MEKSRAKADATDLMLACQSNDVDHVAELLKENASSSDKDPSGKVALHYCTENGTLELVEKVYEGDPSLLDHREEEGYTPLTFAIIGGNVEVAEFLVKKGAEINSVDLEKHSLVHWATVCGQKRSLEFLLKNGALVSLPDIHGSHAIHYATQMCDNQDGLEILQLLLKYGADINCTDLDLRTPLLWASSCGSQKAFIALSEAGADKKCVDKDHLSSIHCAASRGHGDLIELILKLNVDAQIDARDRNGCSPLFYSATLGHVDCTRTLLKNNAQTNFQDKKLRTAAHCAAAKGQLSTLKLLWQFGASFDLGNHRGDLPIHEAAQAGSIEVVDFLVHINPNNINAFNNFGRTPLHLAAANGDLNLCKYLVEKGANSDSLMLSKNELFTSLDVADQKKHEAVVKYLESIKSKKARALPEAVLDEFKAKFVIQVQPEKKLELKESTMQTEVLEKVDQSVEVEVHFEQVNQKLLKEENHHEPNIKVEKHKKKKIKQKSVSIEQQSSDEGEKEETELKKKKVRTKSSKKRNKDKSNKGENGIKDNVAVAEEINQAKSGEDQIVKEQETIKPKKKKKEKEKKTQEENSETDNPPRSGSESKGDDGSSSIISESNSVKINAIEQSSLEREKSDKKLKKEKDKNGNEKTKLKSKSDKPGKLKSKDDRVLSMISEEGSSLNCRNTVQDSEERESEKEEFDKRFQGNSKNIPNGKDFSSEKCVEVNLLNNKLSIKQSNRKQKLPQKISVEQTLFTDNLRAKSGGSNFNPQQNLPDMQIYHSHGRTPQLSAVSSGHTHHSHSSSARGLYRRHRNRYCETCNLNIPANVNRYVEEKRIFQELANLKRLQIQYGKVQESHLVRRLMEDFFRQYNIDSGGYHVDTFHAWERFLYDQLQRLYQREQETVRIKRLQPPGESSLFQKRLHERSVHGNKEQIDSLNRIYGVAPIPLQYARMENVVRSKSAQLIFILFS